MSLFDSKTRLAAAVADWRRRCTQLATALRTAACNDDAWQWRIHLRILSYLLRRYGETIVEPIESPPADQFAEPDLIGRVDPAFVGPVQPRAGRPPRSREQIRIVLIRIAMANGSAAESRSLLRAA